MQIIKKRDTSKPNNSTAVHPSEAVALGCHLIILSFHTREVCTLQGLPSHLRCKISNYSAPYKFRAIPPPELVVYHYNPTSNRNEVNIEVSGGLVVYHYNPTSNRNGKLA